MIVYITSLTIDEWKSLKLKEISNNLYITILTIDEWKSLKLKEISNNFVVFLKKPRHKWTTAIHLAKFWRNYKFTIVYPDTVQSKYMYQTHLCKYLNGVN